MNPLLARRVKSLLGQIEDRLLAQAQADTPYISQAAQHIIQAGGKRFRPTLVILASGLGEGKPPAGTDARVIAASLVVELTHVASLYHDDVMDEADIRRGVPSANAKFGNRDAILVGDYLFARASALVAELGVEYVDLQARTFQRLVQGQINEGFPPPEPAAAREHYLRVVADKTGSLIATSAIFGGMAAGLSDSQLEALGRFGEEIGAVFQLADDLLDITGDVSGASTGKTPGADLKAGVPTLPTLLARAAEPPDSWLRRLLETPGLSDAEVAEALALLRAHPALA
ncbi:MAG: polyprenyl synthetase family protein, partial [Propionibacteriaceae bacterium]|nr:polyprenyl synthetase family protein [Propionibacteriaceae bacterium]